MTVKSEPRSGRGTRSTHNSSHAAMTTASPIPPAPILPQPKRRRRPAILIAGVLLVAVGAVTAYSLAAASTHRTSVIALAADIAWGETITAADIVEAQIVTDPALQPIAWPDRLQVIGQLAAIDLPAGSLLTTRGVMGEQVPSEGQALVGVAVKVGQMPATTLAPGQQVRVSHTAAKQIGDDGATASVSAVVYRIGELDAAGGRTIDVLVAETDADTVAGWSATGSASIVVVAGR